MIKLRLNELPIKVEDVMQYVSSPEAGAIDIFVGCVRSKTASKNVVRLEYEAYDIMAMKEMEKIAEEAMEKWPVQKLAIHHRKGILEIGDIAVVVAVSTPHRQASFEACKYIIDTLKERVPIWKKEVFQDGEEWVSAHA